MNRSEEATEEPYAERLKSAVDDMVDAIENLETVGSTPIKLTASDIQRDKMLSEPMKIAGMADRIKVVKGVFSDFEVDDKDYVGKVTGDARVKLVFKHKETDDLAVTVRLFFSGTILAQPDIHGSKEIRREAE